MSNNVTKELTTEQAQVVNEYSSVIKQIKDLEANAKLLRVEIDSIVADMNPEDTINAETDLYKLEFSKASDSLKLSVPIKQLLAETDKYEVLSVSITECKKQLTEEQLSQYFNVVKGSRRVSVL